MDYYKILGVSREATAEEIRFAYRRRSSECHPDKGGSTEEMAAINEAREVLLDPVRRAIYDSDGTSAPAKNDVGLEAKNLLFEMFDAVLEHAPHENPVKAVNYFLDAHISDFQKKLAELEARIARFRSVAAKVKTKKKGADNLFVFFTERKIDTLRPDLEHYEFVITVSKLARELVNQLQSDDPVSAPAKPSKKTGTIIGTTYKDFFSQFESGDDQ